MKKCVFLLLLPLILTACVRIRIERVERTAKNTETPTPEMLIVRRTYPTRYPTNTPIIPDVMYTITAAAIPPRIQESTPTKQNTSPGTIIVGKYQLEFLGYRTGTNIFTEKRYIELTYRFTNTSDSDASFGWNVFTKAFQDGIELQTHYFTDSESMTDVKPGVSIVVKDGFDLRSDSPIQLEYKTFLGTPVTRTLTLK